MRILLTGANGFIGRHVCKYLREQGAEVIGLDIGPEAKHPEMDGYIQWMLSERTEEDFFPEKPIDAVVHLAADMRHGDHEIEVVTHNCAGEQHLLELAEKHHVKVQVQMSSLPVIGFPKEHPITENHPLHPPTIYHATKRMMELLANYADYTFGLRTVSFRICAPVGIGMNQKTIFPVFIRKALAGEDLTIYGEGSRQQTYIHVRDIAQAIYQAIISEKAHGVYNLASYNRISNLDLAKKIVEVTGSSSKIVMTGLPDAQDGQIWDVCIDRLKGDTAYEPVVSIEECICEQAEYLREN